MKMSCVSDADDDKRSCVTAVRSCWLKWKWPASFREIEWSDGKLTADSDECFQNFSELKHLKREKASVELIY